MADLTLYWLVIHIDDFLMTDHGYWQWQKIKDYDSRRKLSRGRENKMVSNRMAIDSYQPLLDFQRRKKFQFGKMPWKFSKDKIVF